MLVTLLFRTLPFAALFTMTTMPGYSEERIVTYRSAAGLPVPIGSGTESVLGAICKGGVIRLEDGSVYALTVYKDDGYRQSVTVFADDNTKQNTIFLVEHELSAYEEKLVQMGETVPEKEKVFILFEGGAQTATAFLVNQKKHLDLTDLYKRRAVNALLGAPFGPKAISYNYGQCEPARLGKAIFRRRSLQYLRIEENELTAKKVLKTPTEGHGLVPAIICEADFQNNEAAVKEIRILFAAKSSADFSRYQDNQSYVFINMTGKGKVDIVANLLLDKDERGSLRGYVVKGTTIVRQFDPKGKTSTEIVREALPTFVGEMRFESSDCGNGYAHENNFKLPG